MSATHFHIEWTGNRLDWERHETREAAEHMARQLAAFQELFTVEEFGDADCPQCVQFRRAATA